MERHGRRKMMRWRAPGAALAALAVLLTLSACSSGSSSTLNLGLAGSTGDHPSQPPALAANGPAGAYAFVYDNQIWLHDEGKPDAHQLTHLVLSRGAAISWGPLAWSGSGRYIAFALVENLNPSLPSRASGPIYYVDTQSGPTQGAVVNTAATGSIYGHTYDWYGDTMLFYSTGGGIMMYGAINTGNDDPRVWPAVTQFNEQGGAEGRTVNGLGYAYGDIAVTNNYLYYTRITLDPSAPLGTAGAAGDAVLRRISIGGLATHAANGTLTANDIYSLFPLQGIASTQLTLGVAYSDAAGNFIAGSWAVTGDARRLIGQRINNVDPGKGTVASQFCTPEDGCGGVLQSGASFPFAARPNLAISPDGSRVAFTSDTLFVADRGGGGDGKLASAGWATPPAWSNDQKLVAVTQLTGTTTDANGVPRPQTNVLVFDGSASTVLVPGGQDLSWKPASS